MAANGAAPVTPPVEIAGPEPMNYIDDAEPFSAEVLAALATPVDPAVVEVRQPNDLLYVPWIHYQSILVKAFGVGGFRLVPKRPARQQGNVYTWEGSLWVRAPGQKKFQFIEEAIGECGIQSAGNGPEGAKSDCLTKCCKRLNIFMELFDPAWRRAWESKYKATHLAAKGKREWVGQNRAAPAAAAPSADPLPSPSASPPTGTASSPGAAPAGDASSATGTSSAPDTGEAATSAQLEAIGNLLRTLGWKRGFLRLWFSQHFGITVQEPARILGSLSQQQADNVFLLLNAQGNPALVDRLLTDMVAKGQATMCSTNGRAK